MHLSVEYGERLQRVVVGGLEGGDFLGQRERFILFPSPLEADRLQDLGKKKGGYQSSEEDDFPELFRVTVTAVQYLQQNCNRGRAGRPSGCLIADAMDIASLHVLQMY